MYMDCSLPPPLPMEFPGKNTRIGLPFPSSGNLPDPAIEPMSLASLPWQVDSLPLVQMLLMVCFFNTKVLRVLGSD